MERKLLFLITVFLILLISGDVFASTKTGSAKFQLSKIETALERFNLDMGWFPSTKEGLNSLVEKPSGLADSWRGPYISRLPTDPGAKII
ncbi:MAG: hypothetical protein GY754_00505 [bacterium]|nr:hypothetical protein [bacterium]